MFCEWNAFLLLQVYVKLHLDRYHFLLRCSNLQNRGACTKKCDFKGLYMEFQVILIFVFLYYNLYILFISFNSGTPGPIFLKF